MGRNNQPVGEHLLLCERCGYPLEGLPAHGPEANCPECGLAIAASLPSRRKGSAWLVEPGPGALMRTAWLMVRHPVAGWDTVRVDQKRSRNLEVLMSMVAGVVGAIPLAARPFLPIGKYLRPEDARLADLALLSMVFFSVCMPFLTVCVLLLIALEKRGVRFVGKRRGWRITPAIAQTVCGHATVGWIFCAVLTWTGIWLQSVPSVLATIERATSAAGFNASIPHIVLPFVGFVAGMMVFEALVYIGIRQMRFANR